MLRSLHMEDVGPAARFDLELGERLNVLTGDNGLGKSFVLEVAWWALTLTWVGKPVQPQRGKEADARISYEPSPRGNGRASGSYLRLTQDWQSPLRYERSYSMDDSTLGFDLPSWIVERGPVLFATADGGFAVWDPARNHRLEPGLAHTRSAGDPDPYRFNQHELWDGIVHGDKPLTNGLIRDWARWWLESAAGQRHPFELLAHTLEELSHPDEEMRAAAPRRLYLDDPRDYPTVDLSYDNVPIAHLSAGMRRIVSLAYLITWAWSEHQKACELLGWKPADRIVFLIDEIESHLHPKWQRHILPRLLDVLSGLSKDMKPQLLVTTHSPLVLASMETRFDEARDKLFLFELQNREVTLRETPWTKWGDATGWLESPVFGLSEAGSPEAEAAIVAAHALIEGNTAALVPGLSTEDEIERALKAALSDMNPFLVDWYAWRKHGIRAK